MSANKNYVANKNHKSTMYSKLFGENKENALSLYNAGESIQSEHVFNGSG